MAASESSRVVVFPRAGTSLLAPVATLLICGAAHAGVTASLQVSATVVRPVTLATMIVDDELAIFVTGGANETVIFADGRVVAFDARGMACVPADPLSAVTFDAEDCWEAWRR